MKRFVPTCLLTALLLVGATSHAACADGTAHATAASGGVVVPMPKVGLDMTLPAAWSIEYYGGPSKKVKARMRADIARDSQAHRFATHTDLKGFQVYASDDKSQTTFSNSISISDLGPNTYLDIARLLAAVRAAHRRLQGHDHNNDTIQLRRCRRL